MHLELRMVLKLRRQGASRVFVYSTPGPDPAERGWTGPAYNTSAVLVKILPDAGMPPRYEPFLREVVRDTALYRVKRLLSDPPADGAAVPTLETDLHIGFSVLQEDASRTRLNFAVFADTQRPATALPAEAKPIAELGGFLADGGVPEAWLVELGQDVRAAAVKRLEAILVDPPVIFPTPPPQKIKLTIEQRDSLLQAGLIPVPKNLLIRPHYLMRLGVPLPPAAQEHLAKLRAAGRNED